MFSFIKNRPQLFSFIVVFVVCLIIPMIYLFNRQSNSPSPIPNYYSAKKYFEASHNIYVIKKSPLTVRNRSFSASEYKETKSGSGKAAKLNNETIIDYLADRTAVKLLGQEKSSYKIIYFSPSMATVNEGYIAVSFMGNNTLVPVRKK